VSRVPLPLFGKTALYYVLTFVFTVVLALVQQGLSIAADAVILPQLGPGLAALAGLVLFRKSSPQVSIVDRSLPASRYAAAALVPLGAALLVYVINTLSFGAIPLGNAAGTPWFMVLWMPLGALGEELGWRGHLHKYLNQHLTGWVSSCVVGVLWALWHVGLYGNGIVYMGFVVILMISYSVVIYSLVQAAAFNVTLAALFHVMINITNLFSYSIINKTSFMAVNALVWATIALTFVLFDKSVSSRSASGIVPSRPSFAPTAAQDSPCHGNASGARIDRAPPNIPRVD
jgi:uncharacterized protein